MATDREAGQADTGADSAAAGRGTRRRARARGGPGVEADEAGHPEGLRKEHSPVKVLMYPSEKAEIAAAARSVNRSMSTYLREAGRALGRRSSQRTAGDFEVAKELAAVRASLDALRADLGRLGGVFKGVLGGHEDFGELPDGQIRPLLRGTLLEVQEAQPKVQAVLEEATRVLEKVVKRK